MNHVNSYALALKVGNLIEISLIIFMTHLYPSCPFLQNK